MVSHFKLKTPLSHLTNNMTFEIELDRIEEHATSLIIKRMPTPEWDADKAQEDAALLMLLVNSLVENLHTLNERLPKPMDLCPRCAGHTWGRPGPPGDEDYTQRQCHRCGTIRADPEGDQNDG